MNEDVVRRLQAMKPIRIGAICRNVPVVAPEMGAWEPNRAITLVMVWLPIGDTKLSEPLTAGAFDPPTDVIMIDVYDPRATNYLSTIHPN